MSTIGESTRRVLATPDHWREVFKMAAGYAARTHRLSQAIAAVNRLCPEGVGEAAGVDAQALRQAILAAESLEEIGLVGVQREPDGRVLLRRVREWLIEAMRADGLEDRPALPATERAPAGRLLARLGEPALRSRPPEPAAGAAAGLRPIPEGAVLMGSADADGTALGRQGNSSNPKKPWPVYYIARLSPETQAQGSAPFVGGFGKGYPEGAMGGRGQGWAWRGERTRPRE